MARTAGGKLFYHQTKNNTGVENLSRVRARLLLSAVVINLSGLCKGKESPWVCLYRPCKHQVRKDIFPFSVHERILNLMHRTILSSRLTKRH